MKYKFQVPCLFGLEGLVADELRILGMEDVAASDGKVNFKGTLVDMARANMFLRCGERVLIVLAEGTVKTFDDLFELTKAINFEDWIQKDEAFPVKGHALKSKLYSVPDCQSIVKKAVVDRLASRYKVSWFKETGAKHQIQFSIMNDNASIMFDTSGDGLHKRGYRAKGSVAPIRETLAAGIVNLSRYNSNKILHDPFCGSGTFLIEAAMKAKNIAPGIKRKFDVENWAVCTPDIFRQARSEALNSVKSADLKITGSDIYPQAIELTLNNARLAGVSEHIEAYCSDIRNLDLPLPLGEKGIIVCNPPYGERLLEYETCENIYSEMGGLLLRYPDWSLYAISSHEEFERHFGRKADKKRKLYNGMIKCELFQYFKHQQQKNK